MSLSLSRLQGKRSLVYITKAFGCWCRCGCGGLGSEGTRLISAETHHQNIGLNVYEGMGDGTRRSVSGTVVWENNELKTVRSAGKNVKRAPFPSYWDAIHKQAAIPTPVDRS